MILIRVGRRRINLEYLIEDEEGDGTLETVEIPVGAIRVTLQRGKEFLLTGDDAEKYRRQVEPFVLKDSADEPSSAFPGGSSVGHLAPRPAEAQARPEAGGGAAGQAGRRERPKGR